MADEIGYQQLGDGGSVAASRDLPWYRKPGLYVWPSCGLAFIGIVMLAVQVAKFNTMKMPECRKSAPFAVFTPYSHPHAALSKDLCANEPMLLMFGGKGKRTEAFDDIWAMCTKSKKWTEIQYDGHKITENEPHTRWKMAHVTGKDGLYIMGGSELEQDDDDEPPAPKNGKDYYNDVWSYSVAETSLNGWRLLHPGTENKAKHKVPDGRRSHVAAIYTNADGEEVMVVACGRNSKNKMLNDVWEFNVDQKQWTRLFDGDKDEGMFPPGRKGPIAVMAPHPTGEKPYLVIHGGRPDQGYWGDLWAFDLNSNTWENMAHPTTYPHQEWYAQPVAANMHDGPEPRDHHVGHYYNKMIYIHAGRGGINHVWEDAKQFSDLWEFNITAKTWRKLKPRGPKPIGRWLHTSSPVQSKKTKPIQKGVPEMDSFAITGGENMERCYMNDVWEFRIDKNHWVNVEPCTFCQKSCARDLPAYDP